MSPPVDRAARRLLRLRVVSTVLLGGLVYWFSMMTGTYRAPNPYLALSALVGGGFVVLALLVLAQRLVSATPPEAVQDALSLAGRYAPLIALNAIVLNLAAPFAAFVPAFLTSVPTLQTPLTVMARLSGRVLFWLFLAAAISLVILGVVSLVNRLVLCWRPARRAAGILERAAVAGIAMYCLFAMVLTFNGSLDWKPATEHRTKILRVWGYSTTTLWWADVRSWEEPAGIKRVLIFPERDHLWPALVGEGQPVRVRIRPGLFGIPWVESMQVDYEHQLESLVAAAPSAAIPRQSLVNALLQAGRWTEAVEQARTYARYYPRDRAFIQSVGTALRNANQSQAAAALGALGMSLRPREGG